MLYGIREIILASIPVWNLLIVKMLKGVLSSCIMMMCILSTLSLILWWKFVTHELEQAIQCAFLVHYKGKCDVKRGEFERLRAMKNRLSRKGLHATVVR